MIIDLICDRMDGNKYIANNFYNDVMNYGEIGFNIARAMDSGTDTSVKIELCRYILENEYRTDICSYIVNNQWLENETHLPMFMKGEGK